MKEINDKKKVLVVDDDDKNLKFLGSLLEFYNYDHEEARNGVEALEKTETYKPDLILLDIMMPEMDGYEACRRLKNKPETRNIPVVIITALSDKKSRIEGLNAGANDFLTKPVDKTELALRVKNLLRVKEFEDFLQKHNEILDTEVRKKTAQLQESYIDTILRLTKAAEYKDEETAGHIKRSGYYAALLAEKLGWPKDRVETIFYAAPMHDIGKVGIPSDILLKRRSLNPEEFMLMKTHTTIGKNILTDSISPITKMAERIAECHHERWDGKGYPNGLKGEDIPYEARMYNICDQYDALRSVRPYKPDFDHDKTYKILTEGDGRTTPSHFDPKVLEVFKELSDEFNRIYETHKG